MLKKLLFKRKLLRELQEKIWFEEIEKADNQEYFEVVKKEKEEATTRLQKARGRAAELENAHERQKREERKEVLQLIKSSEELFATMDKVIADVKNRIMKKDAAIHSMKKKREFVKKYSL